ncbi:hypothetical protein [Accumulibacter sp.]|uniref:hypothetical protein n=1 Tax=Accumulibacter sp. TaxID=2053492 RepID=UPI002601F754|nr:hypothetical protein [Accumulibacter sp.]
MQPEELFRFVALRAPRARRQRLDLGFSTGSTPFMRELLDDLRQPDASARALARADALLAGDSVPRDPAQNPQFERLERFLARYRRHPPADVATANALAVDVFGRDAAAVIANRRFGAAERNARDAVVALKLRSAGRAGLLARYTRIVQCADFLRRLARDPEGIDFARPSAALARTLSLPVEFAALAVRAGPPTDTPEEPTEEGDAAGAGREIESRVSALDRALVELSANATQLERRTATTPAAQAALVLSARARERLSAPTRALLASERINLATTAFGEAIDALHGARAALVAALPAGDGDVDAGDGDQARTAIAALVLPQPAAQPSIPLDPAFVDPGTMPPTTVGPLRPTGVGQLLIVRQQLLRYEAADISHVHNVMRSETQSRSTRRLTRSEETFQTEEERSSEEERDLQSTERFGLRTEIENTLANTRQFNVGASVSAGYGPFVQVEASTQFETSASSEQAESSATEYAREVTESTAKRVAHRVRTQQTRTTLEEFEENNSHGFDNSAGDSHAVGIYQWLNRVYRMQIYDYGVRLLLECTVLEPAALYLNALKSQIVKPAGLNQPKPLTIRPDQITTGNYRQHVATYRAEDVKAPPPERRTVAHTFSHNSPDGTRVEHAAETNLIVPEGYRAYEVRAAIVMDPPVAPALPPDFGGDDGGGPALADDPTNRVDILVAHQRVFRHQAVDGGSVTVTEDQYDPLDLPEGEVPVAVNAVNVRSYAATVTVVCVRTAHGFEKWQLDTYAALARAYAARKTEYEEKLASLAAAQGVTPEGRNPAMNRILERNEMKRLAIMMLSGQRFRSTAVPLSPQAAEFDFDRMLRAGRYARFWESVIDWRNLDYEFLPYYWARQSTWGRLLTEGEDPLHAQFIAAGAATIRLAATPGMEAALLHFFETGEIWDGGELPAVTRDDFVAFLEEIAERRPDPVDAGVAPLGGMPSVEIPVGDPWEVTLPTTLVRLRPDNTLPQWQQEADGRWVEAEA